MDERHQGAEDIEPVKHNPYLHDLVWDLLRDFPSGRLLDIPSGPGYFARQASENGFKSTAAEIDESLYLFDDVEYVSIDMSRPMPLDDSSFDYVVSIEGIEHIENQYLFLRECSRILKAGGRLFLTTPNASSLEARLGFFVTGVHDNPPAPIRHDSENLLMEHFNLMPFHRLEVFLRFSGFTIEKLTTYKMRKGSRALFPLLYLWSRRAYMRAFRKYFKGRADEGEYRQIFDMYLSREVLCGSHIVVVAVKR